MFLKSFGFNITRTTNKELNVESFMTKTTQAISQSKFHVLSFMFLRVSVLTSLTYHHHHLVSVLNPILGRSSRKPPDPPLHAYDQQGIECGKFHD